ncbi:MAG: glycosyltransferase family 9 protein [Myxococcota bacterium]
MILRRRSLGDVVLVGSIARAVPRPVLVMTERRYHPVVRRIQGVDGVLDWADPVPSVHRIVDLQRSWRSGPCARRLRKHSVARRLRLLGVGTGRPPVTTLYAAAAGVREVPPPWIPLPPAPRDTLVLLPGGSTALKRVPARLLQAVAGRWPGPVLAIGGPGDEPALDALGIEYLCERGFDATFAALGRARIAVGGDSGLSHLAAACGVPTVVVAGPTHPDDGFLGPHFTAVVDRPLSCRPCTLHRGTRCRLGGRPCFDLDPELLTDVVLRCAG